MPRSTVVSTDFYIQYTLLYIDSYVYGGIDFAKAGVCPGCPNRNPRAKFDA